MGCSHSTATECGKNHQNTALDDWLPSFDRTPSHRQDEVSFADAQKALLAAAVVCHGKCLPTLALKLQEAEAAFRAEFPEYEQKTAHMDALREREYGRLDTYGHVYLDYTGGSLYSQSQIDANRDYLLANVYGNPHSTNPSSMASTKHVEDTRNFILEYFNADPRDYEVIFTLNASNGLRLIGESYPFTAESTFLYLADNHNSVVGIREFAKSHNAKVVYAPVNRKDVTINEDALLKLLDEHGGQNGIRKLFAYPAQSNLSGVKHDLAWIETAHERGWDVLLDAAAFAPTNRLDLDAFSPDFVTVSFYKMFGLPTGVGALIAQRSALGRLRRPWFAGGTIEMVSVVGDTSEQCRGDSAEAYEDGTVDYLAIPQVAVGLRWMDRVVGIDALGVRIRCLAAYLLHQLGGLRHANGKPVCVVLGPTSTKNRGGTISLLFYKEDGSIWNAKDVESRANALGISIRNGCFCNPGAMEMKFGVTPNVVKHALEQRVRRGFILKPEYVEALGDNLSGAVRVSFGIASNFRDAYVFARFAAQFAEKIADAPPAVVHGAESSNADDDVTTPAAPPPPPAATQMTASPTTGVVAAEPSGEARPLAGEAVAAPPPE